VTGEAAGEARRVLADFGVDALLAGIRLLAALLASDEVWADVDAERLAAFVAALDEHLSAGNELPAAWAGLVAPRDEPISDESVQ
jgi:hypothetical protein